ncbi:MAG: endonuclease/exonuclease/phosphatase family protein [Burkholderiales bacterium]|jgi:endonuclease/exonuclease/phosphatase family metal-dependent hydrolase|nr:endonuclease/exonuclease/phosphatase family protein [Burkholderiales bacterium]
MRVVTWNIQWCRGVDGFVDADRIAETARALGDFDVLCLQEVARNYPELPGSGGEDQFDLLARRMPGFAAVAGFAVDTLSPEGTRRQFGNLVLSRLPVLQAFRHTLPWPADPSVPTMQRVAVEVVLATPTGPLRVSTTHLEYYSAGQRAAQVERLRELQAEAAGHAADREFAEKRGGPFERAARPVAGILTADFNFHPRDLEYARLQAPIAPGVPAYRDAWRIAHRDAPHAPTLGIHDRVQWPAPSTTDMIFVTEDLVSRVEDVVVDVETKASDHQPVMLVLRD